MCRFSAYVGCPRRLALYRAVLDRAGCARIPAGAKLVFGLKIAPLGRGGTGDNSARDTALVTMLPNCILPQLHPVRNNYLSTTACVRGSRSCFGSAWLNRRCQ